MQAEATAAVVDNLLASGSPLWGEEKFKCREITGRTRAARARATIF
ncbi:MAG: hypothetical protein ACPGVU_00355 [Limisphaerales bacterium]